MDTQLERLVSDLKKVEIACSITNISAYLEFIDSLTSRLPEPNMPLRILISQDIRPHPIHELLRECQDFRLGFIKLMPTTADAVIRNYLKWGKDRYSLLGLQVEEEPMDNYFLRELEEAGVQWRNHRIGPHVAGKKGQPYNNLHEIRDGGNYLKTCFQGPMDSTGYYTEFIKLLDKKSFLNISGDNQSWYHNHREGNFSDYALEKISYYNIHTSKNMFNPGLTTFNELNTIHPWETDLDYAGRVLTCIEKRLLAMVQALEYADKFNNWILRRQPYERRAFNSEAGAL